MQFFRIVLNTDVNNVAPYCWKSSELILVWLVGSVLCDADISVKAQSYFLRPYRSPENNVKRPSFSALYPFQASKHLVSLISFCSGLGKQCTCLLFTLRSDNVAAASAAATRPHCIGMLAYSG